MSDLGHIAVKDFDRFQHYKDRNPPWIKLYGSLLDNYEFSRLQDASKMHLVGIWLLASKCDNRVPADPDWIGRRIGATEYVNLEVLVESGFLVRLRRASDVLANDKQSALPETEGETETKPEKKTDATHPAAGRSGGPPKAEEPVEEIDINTLDPRHRKAVGTYLNTVRQAWWGPDGKPPIGWNEGREASIYIQRRRKGESHDDLLRMVHGARFLVDRDEVDWERNGKRLAKPGDKLTGRLLNNTHNGARDFGSMALDAFGRIGEAKPPPTRKGTGTAGIGEVLGTIQPRLEPPREGAA